MPPVLDPSKSKVDGLAFVGLSLARKSELGHPDSCTHQTAFDLNEVIDREYEFIFSTNDDGWLVGGGEPGPPQTYKLAAKDSGHVEVMRIGTYRPEWGGVLQEDIVQAMTNGSILIPHIEVIPTAVVANPDKPPELEIRFDMEPEIPDFDDMNAPLPTNWQLRFIHNQLFKKFEFPSRFCPGAFHSTILRKAEFRSEEHRAQYFAKCEAAIQRWRQLGPQPLNTMRRGLDGEPCPLLVEEKDEVKVEETKESPPAEPKEVSNEEVTPVPDEDLKDAAAEETAPISTDALPEEESPPANEVAKEATDALAEPESGASDTKEEEIATAEPEVETPTPEVVVAEEEPPRTEASPVEYTPLNEAAEKKEEPSEEQPHAVEKASEAQEDHKDEAPEDATPDEPSSPATIVQASVDTQEVATEGTKEESPTKEYNSGIWLFTDRENITHFFEPNFLPPYDTPEKRKIIMDVLRDEWDEKTLSWKPCGQGGMTKPKPLTLDKDLLPSKEVNENDQPQSPKQKIDEMFGEVLSKITLVCGTKF